MIPCRRDDCRWMYDKTVLLRKSEEKVGFPQAYIPSYTFNTLTTACYHPL